MKGSAELAAAFFGYFFEGLKKYFPKYLTNVSILLIFVPSFTKKIKTMKKQQIINELKGGTSAEVQQAFQQAEKEKGNFSAQFGKTWQYWSNANWDTVAQEVKKHL